MLSPWVGLRKINVSYWGWEDASPFTNTTLRWSPGEPSDSGFCAYLEQAQMAGLKANPCTATTDGLICEKPVGEKKRIERQKKKMYLKVSAPNETIHPPATSLGTSAQCAKC